MSKLLNITSKILVILLTTAVVGCSIYRMDIQQGNYVTQDMVDQLRPGMSKQEVQHIMGTAQFKPPLRPNRWEYYTSFDPGTTASKATSKPYSRRLSLHFKDDLLSHIESDDFAVNFNKG